MNLQYGYLLEMIDERRKESKAEGLFVIGIDGNCGSGKTTLASELAKDFDCEVIHIDDFFLPKELRTLSRLDEIAGNFHYERFKRDVIDQIQSKCIKYRPYQCKRMAYGVEKVIRPEKILIIEGAYSFSHDFDRYYHFKIQTKCSEKKQLKRILKREGKDKLNDFIEKWIPMENRYFNQENLSQKVDIVYDTSL